MSKKLTSAKPHKFTEQSTQNPNKVSTKNPKQNAPKERPAHQTPNKTKK